MTTITSSREATADRQPQAIGTGIAGQQIEETRGKTPIYGTAPPVAQRQERGEDDRRIRTHRHCAGRSIRFNGFAFGGGRAAQRRRSRCLAQRQPRVTFVRQEPTEPANLSIRCRPSRSSRAARQLAPLLDEGTRQVATKMRHRCDAIDRPVHDHAEQSRAGTDATTPAPNAHMRPARRFVVVLESSGRVPCPWPALEKAPGSRNDLCCRVTVIPKTVLRGARTDAL